MATCPKCGGALSRRHRCPIRWPFVFLRWTWFASLGALIGAFLAFFVPGSPHIVGAVVGAIVSVLLGLLPSRWGE